MAQWDSNYTDPRDEKIAALEQERDALLRKVEELEYEIMERDDVL